MTDYSTVPTASAFDELVATVSLLDARVAELENPVTIQTPGNLPVDLPSTAELRAAPKKVFAHYFTPYPISIDNKPADSDYYARGYLNPDGESGKHSAYGGLLRNRPLPRDPLDGPWEDKDMETEIANAKAAGIDGFAIDILSLTSYNWTRTMRLVNVGLRVDPGFLMLMQPDMTTLNSKTAREVAAKTAEFVNINTWRLPDGRVVISPYHAENMTIDYWKEYLRILKDDYGIQVAFFPLLSNWTANIDKFAPISYGVGTWGSRSPKANANITDDASVAHGKGLKWLQPVSIQDERPNGGTYYEAENLNNLRVTWEAAIKGGSDHVFLATWNDYSEGAAFAPSRNYGWTWLDVSAYYINKFKFNNELPIVRDALYLTNRTQHFATLPTYPQTKLQVLRPESSPARNTIEVNAWLVSDGTLTIKAGGKTQTFNAPAGISIHTIPLEIGKITAELTRKGTTVATVASEYDVTNTPLNQNLEYYGRSSRRS